MLLMLIMLVAVLDTCWSQALHPNVHVCAHGPASGGPGWSHNQRHVIVDDSIAFLGGNLNMPHWHKGIMR